MNNKERVILFNLARLRNTITGSCIYLRDSDGDVHCVSLASDDLFALANSSGKARPTTDMLDDMLVDHVKGIWQTIEKLVNNG